MLRTGLSLPRHPRGRRLPGGRTDRSRRAHPRRQAQAAARAERHRREQAGREWCDRRRLRRKRRGGRASPVSHHGRRGRGHAASEQAELRYAARLAPITLVARPTTILVVKPDTPVNSAKGLAAFARDKPATIPFASTGSGSVTHLALKLYQSAANVKFLHVPYRGAAPALTDLLGGQVLAMFADTPVLLPHIRAGKLKPIGAASAERNPMLVDVSTLAEQGFPDTVADNWYGLLAPAKTPLAVVEKLHDAVVAVLNAPDIREKLLQSGATPAPMSSAEFGKFLSDELARWGRVVREKNIKED